MFSLSPKYFAFKMAIVFPFSYFFLFQNKWELFSLFLRSSLMELGLPEPQDMISSSTSSVFVAQEPVLPCCDCKNAEHSTDSSISSGSSYSSSLSHLPVFSEETTWQFRSHSLPILPQNQPPVFRNQGTSQPSFMLSELGKSELFQNLETLSSLSPQSTFINSLFESPDLHRQEEKTKDNCYLCFSDFLVCS